MYKYMMWALVAPALCFSQRAATSQPMKGEDSITSLAKEHLLFLSPGFVHRLCEDGQYSLRTKDLLGDGVAQIGDIPTMALSHDGRLLAVIGRDGQGLIVDLHARTSRAFSPAPGVGHVLQFSPDDGRVASLSPTTLEIWDTHGLRTIHTFAAPRWHDDSLYGGTTLSWNESGSRLLVRSWEWGGCWNYMLDTNTPEALHVEDCCYVGDRMCVIAPPTTHTPAAPETQGNSPSRRRDLRLGWADAHGRIIPSDPCLPEHWRIDESARIQCIPHTQCILVTMGFEKTWMGAVHRYTYVLDVATRWHILVSRSDMVHVFYVESAADTLERLTRIRSVVEEGLRGPGDDNGGARQPQGPGGD